MKQISKTLRAAIICFAFLTILCGIIYPLIVTGIAIELFPKQANGSIITSEASDGAVTESGSKYLGQSFTKPEYLIGRPMGTSNLSPNSSQQKSLVEERIKWWHTLDSTNKKDIPIDLVTASGSGVDPNISPKAAAYQVARIASARGIEESKVKDIIAKCTSNRLLGVWGEFGVNVLEVNIMLDALNKR
jgi:potassium-transporting ATPase KdpC subunit